MADALYSGIYPDHHVQLNDAVAVIQSQNFSRSLDGRIHSPE